MRQKAPEPRSVVFLGGVFTPGQTDLVLNASKGVIQNAADAHQKNILRGLAEEGVAVDLINLPFVGSYPKRFRRPVFPGSAETLFESVRVEGKSFSLVPGLKPVHRFLEVFRSLRRLCLSNEGVILVYSAHLPFIYGALAFRALKKNWRLVLILPDLPEYMGVGGYVNGVLTGVFARHFYTVARRVDGFVVLTRAMTERLAVPPERTVVIEGIAEPPPLLPDAAACDPEARIFLYTGKLSALFGVKDLVDAFREVKNPRARLWICGEGDGRADILKAAAEDPRIRFFGQLPRDEARRLQVQATVLVNPRRPSGEYTKYSFPSKTMEYLASGRPVLMHRLPGMPDEYLPHFTEPRSEDPSALRDAIERMAAMDLATLNTMGALARKFVLSEKNAGAQARKLLSFLDQLRCISR